MTRLFLSFLILVLAINAQAGGLGYCEAELNPSPAQNAMSTYLHFVDLYIERSGHSRSKIDENLRRILQSPSPANLISIANNTREIQLKDAFSKAIVQMNLADWPHIKQKILVKLNSNTQVADDRAAKDGETSYVTNFNLLDQSKNNVSMGRSAQITVGNISYVLVAGTGKISLFLVDLKTGKVTDKNWISFQISITSRFDFITVDDDNLYVVIGNHTDLNVFKIDAKDGLSFRSKLPLKATIRSVQTVELPGNEFAALVALEKGAIALSFDKATQVFRKRSALNKLDSLSPEIKLFFMDGRAFFIAQSIKTSASLYELDLKSLKFIKHSVLPIEFTTDRKLWFTLQRDPLSFEVDGTTYLAMPIISQTAASGRMQLHIYRLEERPSRNAFGWPIKRISAVPIDEIEYRWARYNELQLFRKDGRVFFVLTTEKSFEIAEFNLKSQKFEKTGSTAVPSEPTHLDYFTDDDGRIYLTGYLNNTLVYYEILLESGEFVRLDQYSNINLRAQYKPIFIRGSEADFVAHIHEKLEILSTKKKLKRNREPQGEEEKDCEARLAAPALSYVSMIEIYFESQGAKAKEAVLSSILSSKQILNPFTLFTTVAETQIGQAIDRLISRVSPSDWITIQKALAPLADKLNEQKHVRNEKSEQTQNILHVAETYTEPGPVLNSTPSTYVTTHGRTFVSYSTFEDKKIHLYELNLATGKLENHEYFLTESAEQHGPTFFKLANEDAYLALGTGDSKILLFEVGKSQTSQLQLSESIQLEYTPHVFMPLRLSDGRQLLLVDTFRKDEPKDRHLFVFEVLNGRLVRRGSVSHHIQLTGKAGLLISQSAKIEVVIAGGGKWQRFDLDPSTLEPTFNKTISTHAFEFGVPKRFRTSQDQVELTYFATKNGLTIGWPSESGIAEPILADSVKLGDAAAAVLTQIDGRDIFVLRGGESLTITELLAGKRIQRLAQTNINDCYRYIGTFVSAENRIIITCTDLHKLKIYTFDPATNALELSQQIKAAYDQTPFFVVDGHQAYMITQNHDTKTRQVFKFYRSVKN